ncbi:uncharacterized protein PHALS_00176 [Plasmopara halstedii]|uniref:Uncharacterized protein n=1 Tax=Plasmopara halstedii TaxID=4781 RepID=A0A0P1A6Y9_PLAHL|nr:uncharacterized protein PHALS_00176 [Plasmopara halstedii]CEG35847.1 hypothetical protein PHALS_00176 [Plasmopara halstedii]|eukprot:XP_024572216.1 hypothetical protein PHALS_00176 [Plasmopara halstedii]
MDETAEMLEAYAGGLQQSFGSVFERVGQSLSQSTQVMRMMNEVMESAMLQNLFISTDYEVGGRLIIKVRNDSHVMLGQIIIRVQLHESITVNFSETIESLGAGVSVRMQAPIDTVTGPVQGFTELECISPGTQQPLRKRSPFRILSCQQGTFEALQCGKEGAAPGLTEVTVVSDKIVLAKLRKLLKLSPIDGILINDQGRYRFHPERAPDNDTALYLAVTTREDGDAVYQVTVSAAGNVCSFADRQLHCQQLIDELEIVDSVNQDK